MTVKYCNLYLQRLLNRYTNISTNKITDYLLLSLCIQYPPDLIKCIIYILCKRKIKYKFI